MAQETTHAASAEQPNTPLTVLVAEDFEDTRYLMRVELEQRGFRIVEATNGEEAIAAAMRERPRIVLMDIGLPGMDGIAATQRLRELAETRDTVIVAVTAHHESEYRAKALAAGCNAYVTKPIDFDWLSDLIDRLLP
ncbi:MAG: response regulator [Acidobacteria bacterium]|nr:response regulator [Acidobacteriota bacterium]